MAASHLHACKCTFKSCYRSVNVLQEEWKSQVWTMLDTEEIRLSCDGHMTALTSMGAFSEEWDIRVTLEEEIREILVSGQGIKQKKY